MHATGHTDRSGGGGGGGSWRLPPDETLQVGDPKSKEEDLVYPGDGHNWRSIIFSLMVIGMVIAGIVTAIYLLGYVDELLYWSGRRMRLEEFLRGELTPQQMPPAWVTPTHFVFQADDGGLAVLDTANDTITTLVTNHTLRQLNVRGYQCSPDLRYVLFQHNVKTVFRRTFTAHYTVYDVSNDHHTPVRLKGSGMVQRARLQHAAWLGPGGALVLVADNDIYLRPSPAVDQEWRLTDTGRPGVLYNGVPDWLYQEDILHSTDALWGSPDGSHILYAAFDDSAVGALTFPWFSTTTNTGTFPATRSVRYPTPGSPNPTVKLWIVEVKNSSQPTRWELKPPLVLEGQDYYLTSASWVGVDNDHVAAVWMNRAQNLSIVSTCMSPNWTCIETHSERALEDTWLEVQPPPLFAPDGDSFLLLAEIREGEADRFTHIKHVTITQQRMSVLSHGRYEVLKILAWDTYNHLVYYLGTMEKRPGQQHLYVVRDPVNEDPRRSEPFCITCETNNGGVMTTQTVKLLFGNCSHWAALVAPAARGTGSSHYVLQCQGPGPGLAAVHETRTHTVQKLLWDSRMSAIANRMRDLALPKKRTYEIPLSGGCKARVQLLLPPSWREELRDAAYPVLVQVDGRPGSSQVSEKFSLDWGAYMSSHNDVVYVQLDVRGAAGQGRREFNKRLGSVEVSDQITVVRYLLEMFKFLDVTRVGVWGWGYGGYVTAMLLGSQQQIFKCGIAVSPITDWLYYNSAFTERILGLPTDNYKGYVEADATQRARNVPSHSLYLLHGLADLSAPLQHGIGLAKALSEAGVIFRYQSYADEDHHLIGVLEHVYRSMEDYLKECLSLDPDDTKPAPPDR